MIRAKTKKQHEAKIITPVIDMGDKTSLIPLATPDIPVEKTKKLPVNLIHCKVTRAFIDGNTTERFKELDYAVEWPAEQVRDITMDLYNACVSSGARIEIVPEAE